MSFILDDRHDFCICCSGLILFFVRSDVELHPDSESIPLLIDRVSISIALIFHLFLRRDYWRHTQSKFKFTDILSRRVWKTIDFCHLVTQSELWSVSFWVFWWRHCFWNATWFYHDAVTFLQRTHSGSYGPTSSDFWIDVSGPRTRRIMWAQLINSHWAVCTNIVLAS